jgi:hypothetical protein
MSTRETLRRLAKPKVVRLELEGEEYYVRGLTGAGRATYLELVNEAGKKGVPMHKTAALGLCEPDGTLSYDIDKAEDLDELAAFDGDVLQTICLALFDVSGLSKQSTEAIEKKSEASPS